MLVTGTMSFFMPRGVLFVLEVGQHQSKALVGRLVTNSPPHCTPVSVCACQKYFAPFDAPPRTVLDCPGGMLHHPFLAQLSPSGQFGQLYPIATFTVRFVAFWNERAMSLLL